VLDSFSGKVAQYVTGANGQLTQTPTLVAAGAPLYMAIHPTGLYAYIVSAAGDGTGSIYQFTIAADGTLSPMSTPFLPSGTNPVAMTLDRTGAYVFVTNLDGTLSRFAIGESGALAVMSTINPTPATSPLAIAITN
jgi:6-phosphogluconolactonase (cycloisomerase 2 family)